MNPVSHDPAANPHQPAGGLSLLLVLAATVLLTGACADDSSGPATPAPAPAPTPTPPPAPPEPADSATASYRFAPPDVRISPRVPGSLPDGVDFAPPLALVAHARDEAPFALDETASDGLKLLAETGASAAFIAEADAAGMDILASSFPELLQVFLSPDPSFELNLERPCLTYAQMIAPSSDWFIGFTNICATDEEGNWVDEMIADLLAYDAGTAEGEDFQHKSADTEPREPIALLDRPPYFEAPAIVQVLSATRNAE